MKVLVTIRTYTDTTYTLEVEDEDDAWMMETDEIERKGTLRDNLGGDSEIYDLKILED